MEGGPAEGRFPYDAGGSAPSTKRLRCGINLSHLLNGGGEAPSVVRVGTSLKGLPIGGRNLSGVPKATATFYYILPLLSTF